MLDIASVGNGLVGPGREVNDPPRGQLDTESSPRNAIQDRSLGRTRPAVDRVEVSEHADLMTRLNGVPEVRWDRIEAAREAIAQDGYIDRHLDHAIDQLLTDL